VTCNPDNQMLMQPDLDATIRSSSTQRSFIDGGVINDHTPVNE
jgi:hypothetical protein